MRYSWRPIKRRKFCSQANKRFHQPTTTIPGYWTTVLSLGLAPIALVRCNHFDLHRGIVVSRYPTGETVFYIKRL